MFFKVFKISAHLIVMCILISLFIVISPNNCGCSSRFVHNLIWSLIPITFSCMCIYNDIYKHFTYNFHRPNAWTTKLFFKLFKLKPKNYKYNVRKVIQDDVTYYLPEVKIIRFYSPFYIKFEDKEHKKYKFKDPNWISPSYYSDGSGEYYLTEESALYELLRVRNDNNYRYDYSLWFCHICPARNGCEGKIKTTLSSPLTVNKKNF